MNIQWVLTTVVYLRGSSTAPLTFRAHEQVDPRAGIIVIRETVSAAERDPCGAAFFASSANNTFRRKVPLPGE